MKKQNKIVVDLVYPSVLEKNQKFISLTYMNDLSERIARYLEKRFNCYVSFKITNIVGNIFENNKDRLEKKNKSEVYKLSCDGIYRPNR